MHNVYMATKGFRIREVKYLMQKKAWQKPGETYKHFISGELPDAI